VGSDTGQNAADPGGAYFGVTYGVRGDDPLTTIVPPHAEPPPAGSGPPDPPDASPPDALPLDFGPFGLPAAPPFFGGGGGGEGSRGVADEMDVN
jgi:hypothetical protein